MNAQDLYEELKDAARYLGVRFHNFEAIDVTLEGNKLRLEHQGKEVLLIIPNASEAPASHCGQDAKGGE